MGFLPFRAFPSRAAVAPSSARCPLVVAADAEATATRLQGLHPHESPLDPLGVFTNWYPRCSLGAFSPSGLSPFLPWYRLRGNLLSKTVLIGVQSTIRGAAGLDKNFFVVAANHSHAQESCCPTESQRAGRSACLSRVLPALLGSLASRQPTRGRRGWPGLR